MHILLLATKSCSHCITFSRELNNLGIKHEVLYCEDNSDLVAKYDLRHSPNLVVDGVVVFRKQPSEIELKEYFKC
ncbi:MAG: thioredoxin family protein [Gammaproteobacteria bacterium]|nr:thioredoxin family protein [Gammaproteobacteria bacterium]